jgi:hypothetical protein
MSSLLDLAGLLNVNKNEYDSLTFQK